jgi:hypothetical protein
MMKRPPRLRWLMRSAVSSYSAPHMVGHYWQLRQGNNLTHRDAIQVLTDAVEHRDREHTLKAYGPTHPEARA